MNSTTTHTRDETVLIAKDTIYSAMKFLSSKDNHQATIEEIFKHIEKNISLSDYAKEKFEKTGGNDV